METKKIKIKIVRTKKLKKKYWGQKQKIGHLLETKNKIKNSFVKLVKNNYIFVIKKFVQNALIKTHRILVRDLL